MDGLITVSYCQSIKFTKVILNKDTELKRDYLRKYPREGDLCIMFCRNLTCQTLDSKQIGFDLEKNETLKIGVFTTEISRILHYALQTAEISELFEVSFELSQDLVNNQLSKNILAKSIMLDLKFQIKLIEISYFEKPIFKYDLQDLIALSKRHKADAAELFKDNNVHTAFYRYKNSLNFLIIAEQSTHYNDLIEKKEISLLKSQLYNNMAACQLKNIDHNYEHVISNCTKCLENDHNNSKALYRRSLAYLVEKRYDRASNDLERALKIEPENRLFKEKIEFIEQQRLRAK